jgi:hypothetical protein
MDASEKPLDLEKLRWTKVLVLTVHILSSPSRYTRATLSSYEVLLGHL